LADLAGTVPDTNRQNNFAAGPQPILVLAEESLRIIEITPEGTINDSFSSFVVTFNRAINESTFTSSDVLIAGPGGMIQPGGITPLGDNRYRVGFALQQQNGAYNLTIGPQVSTPGGSAMDQDLDGVPAEDVDSFKATVTISLPDLVPSNLISPATA